MRRYFLLLGVMALVAGVVAPPDCPAPLIWRKGEGWSWEHGGVSVGNNPREQLEIARKLQAKKAYGDAIPAYRRLLARWPASFAAQDARLGLAESLAGLSYYFKAFKEYQQLIEKHPDSPYFETVLERQFQIGNLFMNGMRDKAWGIKWFPARDKAIDIFEQVVKNGPYSKVGADAQFHIGLTYEKQKEYISAVRAYEKLIERWPNHPLAEEAQFEIGAAYRKEAGRFEYDQNSANQAILAFTDFVVRYPQSPKAALAEQYQVALKLEQAKGLYRIGEFYEKGRHYRAALIYYNDVIERNPKSAWAVAAKSKVALLAPRTGAAAPVP